jgi:hypothetical protein
MEDAPKALPPHDPPATGGGFDVDADVATLKSSAKEDYSAQWQAPPPEPKPVETGPEKPADEPPTGEAPPGDEAEASARGFIECYDLLQAWGFHFYSQGKPAQDFTLPKFAKDEAVKHLARGLEKMGSPQLPWWVGLLIALAPPSVLNYMAAREYRRQEQAKEEAEARKNAKGGPTPSPTPPATPRSEPFRADSITTKEGKVVPIDQAYAERKGTGIPIEHQTLAYHSGTRESMGIADKRMPLCQFCHTNHESSRKRKYCGKVCSGKATAGKKRTPAPPPQTTP